MRFVAPIDKGLHLRSLPLFGDLPASRVAPLVEYATEELIAAGTVLQREGAPIETIRVIVEGTVESVLADGRTLTMGSDAVIGVFDFFAGRAALTVTAKEDVIALAIPTKAILFLLDEHFDVVVHIFRGLGRTLVRALAQTPALVGAAAPPDRTPHPCPSELEVERIIALRGTLAFRGASVDGLAALARAARIERFTIGTALWAERDPASWLAIIVEGVVECETSSRAGSPFYFSESTTSTVGFLDVFSDDVRWYRARAMTDVVVLAIAKDDLLDTLEDRFEMALACLQAFAAFGMAVYGRLRGAGALPPNDDVRFAAPR